MGAVAASSALTEVLRLCHGVLVMSKGRPRGIRPCQGASPWTGISPRPHGWAPRVRLIADRMAIRPVKGDLEDTRLQMPPARRDLDRVTLGDGHLVLPWTSPSPLVRRRVGIASSRWAAASSPTSRRSGRACPCGWRRERRRRRTVADDVSTILRKGVERMLATRRPNAVPTEMRLIAEAPHGLAVTGFGEWAATAGAPGS